MQFGVLPNCIIFLTAEEMSPAAEKLRQIAEAKAGTGVRVNLEAPETARLLPVADTAAFNLVQRP